MIKEKHLKKKYNGRLHPNKGEVKKKNKDIFNLT